MIVLDASVLIAHLDSSDSHHQSAGILLEATGAEALGASVITIAETLVSPARAGRLEDALLAFEKLGLVDLELGPGSARRLAGLRSETSLKMPDCCVLLAAREHRGRVASFDKGLNAAALELGLELAGPSPS